MKAIIQISMADDNGLLVQYNNLYKQELKSYTVPENEQQMQVLRKIVETAKEQVHSEIYAPGI